MNIAKEVAMMSYCERKKVGAIILKDNRIISMGWNGTPSNFPNKCEDENNVTLNTVLHAESNAITKLAQSHESGAGAIMFCTISPCMECAKMIYQIGITEFYYLEDYRCCNGKDFLISCGVPVIKLKEE